MAFHFKPAKREGTRLVIGMVGGTGSGKTYTALELAVGLARGGSIDVLDTENNRAKHYADQFAFKHCDFQPPFSPDRYAEAIGDSDKNPPSVLVIDSGSHSHIGQGGILEMHDAAWQKMGGGEGVKMLAWAKPKQANRNMIQAMLRAKSHVIMCLRAEHKVTIGEDDLGKMTVGDATWQPVCEKHLPFELTLMLIFDPKNPGAPIAGGKIQKQHEHLFPLGQLVTRKAGEGLAEWARGASGEDGALQKVIEDIRAASAMEELEVIGKQIADIGLSQYDRGMVVSAYTLRRNQLGKK